MLMVKLPGAKERRRHTHRSYEAFQRETSLLETCLVETASLLADSTPSLIVVDEVRDVMGCRFSISPGDTGWRQPRVLVH